ncbi:MAG: SprB repeat-containing protein [Saprospirales bacterium]|nr:SprB repeat-containing protein [Saprospirales bacterium]
MTIEKIKFAAAARRLFRILVLIFGCNAVGIAQGSLQLSLSFAPPTCNGDTDGAASVAASGGISPYTYNWNNAQLTASIQNLAAGTYIVTVTDNAGTTAIGSVQVVEPAPLHFAVTVNMPSCNNSSGTMTVFATGGTSPYNTLWSNGTMGATAGNLQPGVPYTIQTVDTKGCQADTVVVLPEIDNLNVSLLIAKAECAGVEDGKATAIVDPPGGSYQYLWNIPGAITQQVSNLAPGAMVAVTVTDANSGCTGSASGIVGTHTQLNLQMDSSGNILCAHDFNGWASALASNGTAPYTYAWKGPGLVNASGSMITGLGAGAYGVTATDARGCTVAGGVNIGVTSKLKAGFTLAKSCIANQFFVKITDASSDPSSTIVAWNWTVTWDGGGAFSSSLQNPPQVPIPNQSAGIAQLVVTSAAGCRDTVLLPFKVDGLLDFQVITDGFSCAGGPVPVTVTGDSTFTYKWSPLDSLTFNPGPQQIIANPPGTQSYLLTVSSAMCFDVDSVTITRQPLLVLTTSPVVTCDTTALLTAATNVPATVVWTNLAGDTINPQAVTGGVYIAIATDSFQCVRKDTVSVTLLAVRAIANVPPIACPNIPFNLTAQNLNPADTVTYQWSSAPAGLTINNPGSANATASGPVGQYAISLTVTNQHSCSKNFEFQVNIQDSLDITPFIDIDQACNSTAVTLVNTSGYGGIWIFGDGSGTSTLDSVTYLYPGPGSYLVQFNSSAACVGPFEQMIVVTPDIFSVTAADVTACAASASLTAATSEPATVVWTDLAGAAVANPSAVGAGTYIAVATSLAAQCVDRDTAVVTLQDSIDISQAVTVAAACNSTTISFSNTSGYAGTWVFGDGTGTSAANNGTYTYANFGTYMVTFTASADCVKPAGQSVTTSPDDFSVTAADVTACAATASLTAATSEPATVVWTDLAGAVVANPSAVGAGTYIAVATSLAAQCVDRDTAVVTLQDSIDISQAVTVTTACNSTTISFSNTSGYAGTWVFGDGTGTSAQNNGTYTYAAFGTYMVTFTASADCVKPAGQTVTTSPDDFSVTAADVTACAATASLTATASEPATVVWTDLAGSAVDPSAVGAGTYIAVATSLAAQCIDQDTAVVTLQDSIDISQAVTVTTACNSTTITFSNTSGYAGVWAFGDGTGTSVQNSGTYTYAAFGTYTVTFTANADCVKPAGQTVTTSPDDFSVTASDVTACAASASLSATTSEPATVVWTDLAGTPVDPGAVGAGTYIALATSVAEQCVDQDTAVVTLQDSVDISQAVTVKTACNSTTISFSNTSGYAGTWVFGDGTGDKRTEQRDVHIRGIRDVHGDVHGERGLREAGRPDGNDFTGRFQRDGCGRDGLRGIGEPDGGDERAGNGGVDGPGGYAGGPGRSGCGDVHCPGDFGGGAMCGPGHGGGDASGFG